MPQLGDLAPDFELSGVVGSEKRRYRLSEATGAGDYVLLVFYPADFSPVCTAELCAIRDSEFFVFTDNVQVWGVSGDSLYAHRAFGDKFGLNFPLLADTGHEIAKEYSSRYDEWEGQPEMTKRAVFLVGPDRRLLYVWRSDDAYVEPDLWPIKEALDAAISDGFETEQADLPADPYESPPVEPLEEAE